MAKNTAKKASKNRKTPKSHVSSESASANLAVGKALSARKIIAVCYILFAIGLVFASYLYSVRLENDLLNTSYVSLKKQTEQQKLFIYEQMQGKIESLELFAGILSFIPDKSMPLEEVAKMYDLNGVDDNFFIVNTDGRGNAPFYGSVNISNDNYFAHLKEGKTVFSQMYYTNTGASFFIFTPITYDGKIEAYLGDEVTVNYLTTLLQMSEGDFDYTYILDMSGNTVALNDNEYVLQPTDPLPRVLQNMVFNKAGSDFVSSYGDFERKFISGDSGFIEITQKNNMRLGYFSPVGINSWTIVAFLPMEAVNADLRQVSQNFYIITFVSLLLTGVFIVGIGIMYVRALGLKDKLVRELMSRAETDPLTKLFTKREVEGRIVNYLAYTADSEKSALFIVDIDNFKEVNAYFGEEYGDVILKEVAQKIKTCFRASDLVARIDGNQFLVFLQAVKTEVFLPQKAELINEMLRNTHIGNKSIILTASIGISICPQDGTTYDSLYEKADLAMYYVKEQGKGAHAFYNKEHKKIALKAKEHIEKYKNSEFDQGLNNQFLDIGNLQSTFVSLMYSQASNTLKLEEILRKLTLKYAVDRGAILEYDTTTHAINSVAEFFPKEQNSFFSSLHTNFVETKELAVKPLLESSAVVQVYPDISEESESVEEKFLYSIGIQSFVAISFVYEKKKGLLMLATNKSGHVWKRNDYDLLVFVARLYALYKRNLIK